MNRRELLRKGGVAVTTAVTVGMAGCAGDTGDRAPTGTPAPTATEVPAEMATTEPTTPDFEPLHPRITDHGHYSWFALNEAKWGRQSSPYDIEDGSSRWLAEPTDDGGVRIMVRDIDYYPYVYQNAGFDVHLGRLGDIEEITVVSEEVQSGSLQSRLLVALFLDEDDDGEFFTWEKRDDDRDSWVGLNGDEEAILPTDSKLGEPLVIDDETGFQFVNRGAHQEATLGQLKRGEIEVIDGGGPDNHTERETGTFQGIDGDTEAAVYVGLADTGKGDPVEAIVRGVDITRT